MVLINLSVAFLLPLRSGRHDLMCGYCRCKSVIAESALLKHQLLIVNRPRRRAPNLRVIDRFIAAVCFHSSGSSGTISDHIEAIHAPEFPPELGEAAAGELNSPSVLGREGWTKRQFQAGDQITITVFPSKTGAPVGVVDRTHPIMANGKEAVKANARNVD
jgi:hypothetical protein